jgi:biopolymer transport protein ExbB/TolQ
MKVILKFADSFGMQSDGFFFMWIMLLMAAIGTAIVVERIFYLTMRANINAPKFMDKIFSMVKANKMDAAIELCKKAPAAALPQVTKAGLEVADTTQRQIQNAMDEATLEVIPPLEKRTGYLNMIANTSTMTGLMGTIYGLILCFDSVGQPGIDPAEKTALLASGISTAMNTTLFGLVIAVPLTMVFTWLTTKTTKIIDEIDEYSVKLINILGSR